MKLATVLLVSSSILTVHCQVSLAPVPGVPGVSAVPGVPGVPAVPDTGAVIDQLKGVAATLGQVKLPPELTDLLSGLIAILCGVLTDKNGATWLPNQILFLCVNCPANGVPNKIAPNICHKTCYNPQGTGNCPQDANLACSCNDKFYEFGQYCVPWSTCDDAVQKCATKPCDADQTCTDIIDPVTSQAIKICVPKDQLTQPAQGSGSATGPTK